MVKEQSERVSLPAEATQGLAVFAATAGAVASLPIPFLDSRLVRLVRGASLRRVARHHRVRLSSGARRVLTQLEAPTAGGRLVRRILARSFESLRLAGRLEQGLRTWAEAVLLDHYLSSGRRVSGAPLLEDEALQLKAAMTSAAVASVLGLFQDTPSALPGALRRAMEAVWTLDAEDRTPIERGVDALLDAAADMPHGLVERLCEAFDSALAGEHVSRRD